MKMLQRLMMGVVVFLVWLTALIILTMKSDINSQRIRGVSNGSREAFNQLRQGAIANGSAISGKPLQQPPISVEKYDDLVDLVIKVQNVSRNVSRSKHSNPTIGELLGKKISVNTSELNRFHLLISSDELYKADDKRVDLLLHQASTLPIQRVELMTAGAQTKFTFFFEGGMRALFKPMRYSRETQTLLNVFHFVDFERHNAEIATFHLDRLLGFRRAMPTVGRAVNITSDIYEKCSNKKFRGTFFRSPDNNNCFYGICPQLCWYNTPICGHPDLLEGSLAMYLPDSNEVQRSEFRHPWIRKYRSNYRAAWQDDPQYCQKVKNDLLYKSGRRLLDLMDMSVFDFLSGNWDRHHYETLKIFGNNAIPLHLDQGRGFGRPFQDYMDSLAPLYHCCLIRLSTLSTLLRFQIGSLPLSEAMRQAMAHDPVSPVLWEPHLQALDRRLQIVLKEVRKCIEKAHSPFDVVIDDDH